MTTTKGFLMQIPEPLIMPTSITGQNGAVETQSTQIGVTGCKPTRGHAHAKVKPAKRGGKRHRRGK